MKGREDKVRENNEIERMERKKNIDRRTKTKEGEREERN